MSGYAYGHSEPIEECEICGGEAHAEFCDVGVGMVQISPFACIGCGAVLSPLLPDGSYASGWVIPQQPSERGERVTGYYITDRGHVFEMTNSDGHADFNRRMGTSTSALLARGWVRMTFLEGYAIDMPPFMTRRTRSKLSRLLSEIDRQRLLDFPYVLWHGDATGCEQSFRAVMSRVATLPLEPVGSELVQSHDSRQASAFS